MRLRRTMAVFAVCAVGVLSLVGCSSSEGDVATAQPATPASQPATTSTAATGFDPCSLSDADISAVGLDPETKDVGAGGVEFPGYDICTWLGRKPNWYQLNVYATNEHTYEDAIHNTKLYKDPQPATIAGIEATQLHSATSENDCSIVLNVPSVATFQVSAKFSAKEPGDACAEAVRISTALAKDVPTE